MSDDLSVIRLIRTNLVTRGCDEKEQKAGHLCRRIEQWWDLEGNLLFEYDPCPDGKTMNNVSMTRFSKPRA